nr:hypothetical protein GCM10017611_51530 [Rhodococcus wratislaviensis]
MTVRPRHHPEVGEVTVTAVRHDQGVGGAAYGVQLPSDVRAGDLLAVAWHQPIRCAGSRSPCTGTLTRTFSSWLNLLLIVPRPPPSRAPMHPRVRDATREALSRAETDVDQR